MTEQTPIPPSEEEETLEEEEENPAEEKALVGESVQPDADSAPGESDVLAADESSEEQDPPDQAPPSYVEDPREKEEGVDVDKVLRVTSKSRRVLKRAGLALFPLVVLYLFFQSFREDTPELARDRSRISTSLPINPPPVSPGATVREPVKQQIAEEYQESVLDLQEGDQSQAAVAVSPDELKTLSSRRSPSYQELPPPSTPTPPPHVDRGARSRTPSNRPSSGRTQEGLAREQEEARNRKERAWGSLLSAADGSPPLRLSAAAPIEAAAPPPPPVPSGEQATAVQDSRPVLPVLAGDILYAITTTAANSDYPSPVIAKIPGGPLAGGVLLGAFRPVHDKLILSFHQLTYKGHTHPINAVAVDIEAKLPAVATGVDRHYGWNFGAILGASFLRGLGTALQRGGTETYIVGGSGSGDGPGGAVSVEKRFSTEQQIIAGLGEVGAEAGRQVQARGRRPPTITVAPGTAFGLLILASPQATAPNPPAPVEQLSPVPSALSPQPLDAGQDARRPAAVPPADAPAAATPASRGYPAAPVPSRAYPEQTSAFRRLQEKYR